MFYRTYNIVDYFLHAYVNTFPFFRPHQNVDGRHVRGAQQFFNKHLPHETSGARNENIAPAVKFSYFTGVGLLVALQWIHDCVAVRFYFRM